MEATARDTDFLVDDRVDEAVLSSYSSRPISLELVFEWLWFAQAFVAVSLDVFNEDVNATQNFPIATLLLPVDVI